MSGVRTWKAKAAWLDPLDWPPAATLAVTSSRAPSLAPSAASPRGDQSAANRPSGPSVGPGTMSASRSRPVRGVLDRRGGPIARSWLNPRSRFGRYSGVVRVLLAFAVVAASVVPARADDASAAAALFDRGRQLAKDGNHEEACPLFERSLALLPALGTELNLALCWTAVGRLVDAAALFDGLIAKTTAPEQAKRHEIVVRAAETLAKRIPRLEIELPVGASNLRVDGKEAIEGPIRVDPGSHRIAATGAVEQTVDVGEGTVKKVVLVAEAKEPPPPPPPVTPKRSRLPWYVGGAGVGVLVVGSITGAVVLSRRDAGLDHCDYDAMDELHCDPRGAELLDSARRLSHVTTGMFVVGGALLATGIVLEVLERKKHPVLTGWVGPRGGGLAYEKIW